MKDFNPNKPDDISQAVSGKTIMAVETERGMDDYLLFRFIDGTTLRIRYDYIYEWKVEDQAK